MRPVVPNNPIYGFACRLRTARMRRAVRAVLARIRDAHPKDFARLENIVRAIAPLSQREARSGTAGRWAAIEKSLANPDDPSTWHLQTALPVGGTILLCEGPCETEPFGLVAHEFGHAATRESDLERRDPHGLCEQWASELAADWYARKWGFTRKRTCEGYRVRHAGPPPGRFTLESDDLKLHCIVTRSLCMRVTRKVRVRRKTDGGA
jgi:hypothetical protein